MAEPVVRDRLRPALLDRLTDSVRTLGFELGRNRESLFADLKADVEARCSALVDADLEDLPPTLRGHGAEVLGALAGTETARNELARAWLDERRAAYGRLLDPELRRAPRLTVEDLKPFGRLDDALVQRLEMVIGLEHRHRFERVQDRVQTMEQLEQSVLRNLRWLLNTEHFMAQPEGGSRLDRQRFPLVARSVLNYGTPAIVGVTLASIDDDLRDGLAAVVREAIIAFEPRLVADTVQVRVVSDREQLDRRALHFAIEADLFADPATLHLLLTSIVDLEDGSAELRREVA